MSRDGSVSRRDVLKTTGGALGGLAVTSLAAAEPGDKVEVNVGFGAEGGRRAAVDRADSVVAEFDHIDAVTIRLPKRAADALASRADVRYVERNHVYTVDQQTLPWGIDRTDADVAHANGETGNGADVAIIDTGIDSDHEDLQANLGVGRAFEDCRGNPRMCVETWDDDHDHGTHVAGTANAVNNDTGVVGVSTEATLHAVKVCDKNGRCSSSNIAAGIEWSADQGHDVQNISLGSSTASSVIQDAVQFAAGQGVTIASSAGNSGPCTDCVGFPAAFPEVIAVSASTCNDSLAGFSSTGPEVELAAPGQDVLSSVRDDSYATFSGTSMASPHVAGAAGQLAANGLSRSQIRSTLKNNAENVGLTSNESGAGLLDVAAALGLDSSDDGTGNSGNC